jgi:hypothetical protein
MGHLFLKKLKFVQNWYLAWQTLLCSVSKPRALPPESLLIGKRDRGCIPPPPGAIAPSGPGPPHCGFTITLNTPHSVALLWTSYQRVAEASTWQHTTLTPEAYMLAAWFEPTTPNSERPQTHALERAATGMGSLVQQAVGNRWMALVQDRVQRLVIVLTVLNLQNSVNKETLKTRRITSVDIFSGNVWGSHL